MRTVYDHRPNIDDLPNRNRSHFPDLDNDADFWELYDIAKKYSMVHIPGFYNVYSSLKYVQSRALPGDFVECGVWLGGMSLFVGLFLERVGATHRTVHLYDTFEGFPEGESDFMSGKLVRGPRYRNFRESVEQNLIDGGVRNYRTVEGPVERTLIDQRLPAHIAILRLDTDFYSSTRVELEHLFPRLAVGGVLIVDDYGYYEGSRRACDEYLGDSMLWNRIDRGIRCAVKVA